MKKISIIIPIYNALPYLNECLESIFNQSFTNWEAILIDDCSTDNSYEVAKEYVKRDERIKLFQMEKNSGSGPARNKGLENSVGCYIYFLDPDDRFYNDQSLELLVDNFHDEVDAVCGNVFQSNKKLSNYINRNFVGNIDDYGDTVGWWRFLYKKSIIADNSLKFLNLRRGQDSVFFASYVLNIKKIKFISDYVYWYRVSNNMNKLDKEKIFSYLNNYLIRMQIFTDMGNKRLVNNVFLYYKNSRLLAKSLLNKKHLNFNDYIDILKLHRKIMALTSLKYNYWKETVWCLYCLFKRIFLRREKING